MMRAAAPDGRSARGSRASRPPRDVWASLDGRRLCNVARAQDPRVCGSVRSGAMDYGSPSGARTQPDFPSIPTRRLLLELVAFHSQFVAWSAFPSRLCNQISYGRSWTAWCRRAWVDTKSRSGWQSSRGHHQLEAGDLLHQRLTPHHDPLWRKRCRWTHHLRWKEQGWQMHPQWLVVAPLRSLARYQTVWHLCHIISSRSRRSKLSSMASVQRKRRE